MKSMMNQFSLFAVAAIVAVASGVTVAHAEEPVMNEIMGTTVSALTFGSNQTTAFAFVGGYSRTILVDMLQLGAVVGFATGGGTTAISVTAGPTFNLPMDNTGLRNAFFLTAEGGITNGNFGTATSYFEYSLAVGKRFELFKAISWDPSFSMSGFTATGQNPTFALNPIALSFLF